MSLFFETANQASCFLLMTPIGFAVALLLDADAISGWLRPAADVLALLCAGAALLAAVAATGESGLRLYHLLGVLTGGILYHQGVGRIVRMIARRRRAKIPPAAGNPPAHAESYNTRTERNDAACAERSMSGG